jgi:hypothetical protein
MGSSSAGGTSLITVLASRAVFWFEIEVLL